MKCLRCGYCCTNYIVVIVVDPKKGIQRDNLQAIDLSKEKCPHLDKDKSNKYMCRVHNESWYKDTPCYQYEQIGNKDSNCRIGEYILGNKV